MDTIYCILFHELPEDPCFDGFMVLLVVSSMETELPTISYQVFLNIGAMDCIYHIMMNYRQR